MDYWCSLWFWEYKDADALPTRQEFWGDIEALLDVDNAQLDTNTRRALERVGMAAEPQEEYERISEEESQIMARTQEELLTASHANLSLFADEEPLRLRIADALGKRYHFFHPMLEFIEVFWLRDGFDIICGNPPFLKLTFEPQKILSDKYPELVIRPETFDADYVYKNISNYLTDGKIEEIYNSEYIENACCQALLNAPSLYSELKGGQTDLFKCILLNSTFMLSSAGYMGMIHPDTVFTEAKGQPFRKYLYPRLHARYHYTNRKKVFSEVDGHKVFDCCIYHSQHPNIHFDSISWVFIPQTIDACYCHNGFGLCKGIDYVDEDGNKQANTEGHKERIVLYDEEMLKFIAALFENTSEWDSCKLVTIHSARNINVLKKLMNLARISTVNPFISEGFHATNALKDNTISATTKYPEYNKYEMIFNSTQVGNMSPFSKLPQAKCTKEQYDNVDYSLLPSNYRIRTNYVPKTDILSFKHYIDDTETWFDRYKICFKKMLVTDHERTLKGGIILPKSSHTHSLNSVCFDDCIDLLQFAGLASSVVLDFFVKTVGVRNLTASVIQGLPFKVHSPFKEAIIARVLRLNCVNEWYKSLWEMSNAIADFGSWSKNDKRLSILDNDSNSYNDEVLLRNDFERRMAMVEIDVLVSMAIGLELSDLEFIY
jgi:hypothetical protein